MPHQVNITSAKTGPDRTVASGVLANVSRVDFQLNDKRLQVYQDGAGGNVKEFDLSLVAAVTFSIITGNYTVTVA